MADFEVINEFSDMRDTSFLLSVYMTVG